jgi:ubiquinone/menaquinone biosynthesis C-methylase UbiE
VQADGLYNDPDLVQFYDIENEWGDDFEYCKNLAAGCSSTLDLGCGTGMFAASMAQDTRREVVGVDAAGPMLDIAARRPGGERVSWVQDDARKVQLNRRFDLIVLTGHAFQVFLWAQDQSAVLRTIARHLTTEGRFIFDSRNPLVEAWKTWTPHASERLIKHPIFGEVLAWNDASQDPQTGIVTYGTYYRIGTNGRIYSSRSKLAFPSRENLSSMMHDAGLVVERWLGNWAGLPFSPTDREIIPIGRLR